MTNNDILRRIRFIKDFNDQEVIEIFSLGMLEVNRETISKWLKKDDHPDYVFINDKDFSSFLAGLIIKLRGRKNDEKIIIEEKLTNNIILRKLTIAFSIKSEEVIDILKLSNFRLGKSELSAFFRKPTHKNYRDCKSQILRNFLKGLQIRDCEEISIKD